MEEPEPAGAAAPVRLPVRRGRPIAVRAGAESRLCPPSAPGAARSARTAGRAARPRSTAAPGPPQGVTRDRGAALPAVAVPGRQADRPLPRPLSSRRVPQPRPLSCRGRTSWAAGSCIRAVVRLIKGWDGQEAGARQPAWAPRRFMCWPGRTPLWCWQRPPYRLLAERARRKTLVDLVSHAPAGTIVVMEKGPGGPAMWVRVGGGSQFPPRPEVRRGR